MRSLLCATVTAPTMAELRRQRDEVTDADLVEMRLDTVSDPNVAGALAGRRRPVIVTCRPTWEGGHFAGAEEDRCRLLTEALALGAEYVDVEWRARFDELVAGGAGRRIVLSSHDFDCVPEDLRSRITAMRSTGAEVVKVAAQTRRLSDCIPLLTIGSEMGRDGGLVVIGMGEHGLATRVLAPRFGSMWTYAGNQTDIGQVTPQALIEEFGVRTVTESTDVYGLVGAPVAHSVSPAMYNAAFRAVRLDAVYVPFLAADADDFVSFGQAIGLKGASVTVPFKVALAEQVDESYSVARRVGAINTIRVTNGRWVGANTDAIGFLEPLRDGVPVAGLRASVLGSGGAARGVAIALASANVSITVHARNQTRAKDVAMLVPAAVGPWPPEPHSWDMLINCTSVGMHPHVDDTPIDADRLTGRLVYDLVYNPPVTRLLREAEAAGCRTMGGLDMLVAQAQEQFQWWTGTRPPVGVMRTAALKRLAEFSR